MSSWPRIRGFPLRMWSPGTRGLACTCERSPCYVDLRLLFERHRHHSERTACAARPAVKGDVVAFILVRPARCGHRGGLLHPSRLPQRRGARGGVVSHLEKARGVVVLLRALLTRRRDPQGSPAPPRLAPVPGVGWKAARCVAFQRD